MLNLYRKDSIKLLEIELTTYCNASCGLCDRNNFGGEHLTNRPINTHMSLETWENIIDAKNLSEITTFRLDGTAGDASMHPHLIKMLEMLAERKPSINLHMSTNGGARSLQFWRDLAKVLNKFEKHQLNWSIDGLEDTNHIYRRRVKWHRLIENAQAFIDAGGFAAWQAIIFDHNKHQVNDMQLLAKKMKFKGFFTRSNWNTEPSQLTPYKELPGGTISSPSRKKFKSKYKVKTGTFQYSGIPHLRSKYPCPFGQDQEISIGADGLVWPCCYIYSYWFTDLGFKDWENYNNINKNSLEEILKFINYTLKINWRGQNKFSPCNACHLRQRKIQQNS